MSLLKGKWTGEEELLGRINMEEPEHPFSY